jgi:hypothetical protein
MIYKSILVRESRSLAIVSLGKEVIAAREQSGKSRGSAIFSVSDCKSCHRLICSEIGLLPPKGTYCHTSTHLLLRMFFFPPATECVMAPASERASKREREKEKNAYEQLEKENHFPMHVAAAAEVEVEEEEEEEAPYFSARPRYLPQWVSTWGFHPLTPPCV